MNQTKTICQTCRGTGVTEKNIQTPDFAEMDVEVVCGECDGTGWLTEETNEIIPICIGCNKKADEIDEYVDGAKQSGISVNEYVEQEEGTYNETNGHFLCTDCYINAGAPSKPYPDRWVTP